MDKLTCIIHYEKKDSLCSKIKAISEVNREKIYAAKQLREKLGGQNHHALQCSTVPDLIDAEKHGIHLEPCYKKFVRILSDKTDTSSQPGCRSSVQESSASCSRPKRAKTSVGVDSRGVYPKECNFCKKYRVKRQHKNFWPVTISTEQAATTLKQAAEASEDQDLYYEIKDLDLIAKEFKYHKPCYREFTRKIRQVNLPSPKEPRPAGDFDSVVECINVKVLCENQAVSMKVLHDIFGLYPEDTRYRNKLKARIQSEFGDKIYFLVATHNTPEVVVNASAIDHHTLFNDRSHVIEQAAQYLREDIIQFAKATPELAWPFSIDEVTSETRQAPDSVLRFLQCLLQNKSNQNSEAVNRLVQSYSSDLLHGVTKGKFITAKHFLLGLGLHNITGQKKPVQIASHLGHSIDYNLVCEIETSYAEKAQLLASMSGVLPVKPKTILDSVLTFFWVDNFDINVETQTGHGAINSTHMVAFQEESDVSELPQESVLFERMRKRRLELPEKEPDEIFVDAKKEPPTFPDVLVENQFSRESFLKSYFLWIILRKLNVSDQTVPNYSGWCTLVRKISSLATLKKTVMIYLPPIEPKVTEFSTIYRYLLYLQKLSAEVNMPYVNVTLDVGAAMNAYKVTWNFQEQFKNVLIHLGDFHFMKENFGVIGKIVSGSGVEDVIFQANVCSSGSLNGVLSGSHYNRAWTVHSALSEALERLLFERFISENDIQIPNSFIESAQDHEQINYDAIKRDQSFYYKYQDFKEMIREGRLGLTPQFWLCYYLDLIEVQQLAHRAVQENNLDLRTACWKFFVPFYFAMDKTNYARYGAHYVAVLERMEQLYPGLKDLLDKKGMSVQAQEKLPLRVAIDQRGEQTLNRDAKTTGGIKNFASDSSAILKWTLNRAEQAKSTDSLLKMADLKSASTMYTPLRPSQILKSEKLVSNIVKVLKEEYLNPFDESLDKMKLWNLSSGIPVSSTLAESIIGAKKLGEEAYESFCKFRIDSKEIDFHAPISRLNLKLFKHTGNKVTIKSSTKSKCIEANRNVLGTLLAISCRNERAIDFETALKFPLCSVPLSLANPDGSRRSTMKSKLQAILLQFCKTPVVHPREILPAKREVSTFIIDMMASIRTLTALPDTYEEFTWKFIKSLPNGYHRVDIVADTYQDESIKSVERQKRGSSERILIQSVKSKMPRNFSDFLTNGENKRHLIILMEEYIKENRLEVLNALQCSELYISTENNCSKLTLFAATTENALSSNQEEADTKVALHCNHATECYPEKKVIVRSPSGDVDILVILLSTIERQHQVYLDFGTSLNRKGINLGQVEMAPEKKSCLVGFHAFTGNDYVSSFFKKGKALCWKVLQQNERFVRTFNLLGSSWEMEESTISDLEEYVCLLYGCRQKKVNEARKHLFDRKYLNQKKVIDISLLPPCQSALKMHILRSNVVARIWNCAGERMVELPDLTDHGWHSDLTTKWIEQAFPNEVEEILLQVDDDVSFEEEEESDDDSSTED